MRNLLSAPALLKSAMTGPLKTAQRPSPRATIKRCSTQRGLTGDQTSSVAARERTASVTSGEPQVTSIPAPVQVLGT
jgi:hypothetical protein